MNEAVAERRRPEAAALRGFFQEQWEYLLRLLAGREGRDSLPTAELERAVEALVDGTDGRIRMVFSYRKRLREGVRAVLEHVEAVVAELPPARELSRRSFTADPLINVVFPGADDIPKVLSESAAVQEFIAAGLPPECRRGYSVLAATPQQKRVLGMELIGDRVVRDVQQSVLLFTERRAQHPGVEEAQVRREFSRYLFDTVVLMLRAHLTKDADAGTSNAADGPEAHLNRLSKLLYRSGELIRLRPRRFTVTKQGVLVPDTAQGPVSHIEYLELDLSGLGSSLILLVSFPLTEVTRRAQLLDTVMRTLDPFSR